MCNWVVTLALTAILSLLLPASDSTKAASPAEPTTKQQNATPVAVAGKVAKIDHKSELDKSLLELPIMFGRPAPSVRNFQIGGN